MRAGLRQRLVLALGAVVLFAAAPTRADGDLRLESFPEASEEEREQLREAMYEEVELLETTLWSPRPSEEALRRLMRLARRLRTSAVAYRSLARVAADMGDHREAEEALRRAEALEPEALWPIEDQIEYSASRGNWSGQLGALKRLSARRQSQLDRPGERERLAETLGEIAELIDHHQIDEDPLRYRRQAAELFPERYGAAIGVIRWLVEHDRIEEALEQFEWARRLRPTDRTALTQYELELLFRLGRVDQAREVLQREIAEDDGLRPTSIFRSYTQTLDGRGELEAELRAIREQLRAAATPGEELAWGVHMLMAAGAESEASSALDRALTHIERATDEELLGLSALLLHAGRDGEALRMLTRCAAGSRGSTRDQAQLRLALLLAEGRGDGRGSGLSALLSPSRLDPGPSVVGGLLSLLLAGPPGVEVGQELRRRDRIHVQAAQAAALFEDLARRRSGWAELPRVERRLIATYRAYGAHQIALIASRRFLERHPEQDDFFTVGLGAVELIRSLGRDPEPLLRRLAARAVARDDDAAHRRVMAAWERHLTEAQQLEEVVTVYWAAIEDRPSDGQLYENFLRFLSRHNLHDESQRVFERAIERFEGSGWPSRYGRWLIRNRSEEASRELSRRLLDELGSSELASYLREVIRSGRGSDHEAFYHEIYTEALRRHPAGIGLARRLLGFYDLRRSRYEAEREALLVRYAPYDSAIRDHLYWHLAENERLGEALVQLGVHRSLAGRMVGSDYLIRRAEHELARDTLAALVEGLPGNRAAALRLVALEDALGDRDRARELLGEMLARWPVDQELLTRAGELALEAGVLAEARNSWRRIHEAAPGDPDAYLRTATLYWDYYLFDDAIRTLLAAREAIEDEGLFAYQLAAVHESAGNLEPAVREYVRVLAQAAGQAEVWPPASLYRSGPNAGSDLEHCAARLTELASRSSSQEVVEAVLRDALASDPDDHGLVHLKVDLLEQTERWEPALELLAEEALRINAASLQERAIRELASAGREVAATAILQRLAQNRPLDLAPTFRLASYLERRGHLRSATRALRGLAARLADEDERDRDQQTVEMRLARMLYAHQRFEDAIDAGLRAIALAQGRRERRLRVEVARWLNRSEQAETAITVIEPVLAQEPDSTSALDVHASALIALGRVGGQRRQEVVLALIQAFDRAIEAARDRGHDRQVRPLRETLVEHLLELEAHRAVLDQNVALLNAELEDGALARRAYQHASENDLVENLERRYQRDAERSPRDHRLPLVLARLRAFAGDFAGAAGLMERSLSVAPERLDLRRELIQYLVRRSPGEVDEEAWRQAAQQYRELAELEQATGDSGVRSMTAEAVMYGRVGDWDAMGAALDRLSQSDPTNPQLRLRAARVWSEAGRRREAWAEARDYLVGWRDESGDTPRTSHALGSPSFDFCVELAVDAGEWTEAAAILEELESGWARASREPYRMRYRLRRLERAAHEARTTTLVHALRRSGVDREIRRFVDIIERKVASVEVDDNGDVPVSSTLGQIGLAELAGAPESQIELHQQLMGRVDGLARESVRGSLIRTMERLGATRELQGLLERESIPDAERLPVALSVAEALADREAEARALRAMLERRPIKQFDQQSQIFERLLELRWDAGGDAPERLVALARPGAPDSGQVINFLLEKGRHAAAAQALERYGEGEGETLWMNVARAQIALHRARRGPPPDEHLPFTRALDLRPIGDQVDDPASRRQALFNTSWTALAQPYGEALARSSSEVPAGRRRLDLAVIERSPRSARAHARVARAALTRSDPATAVAHFRLARQLEAQSTSIRDGLAQALILDGERDQALELWDGVLADCRQDGCFIGVIESMIEAGMAEAARERMTRFLRRRWRSGEVSVGTLQRLARLQGERERDRGGIMDRLVWDLWQIDRTRTDLLRAAADVDRSSPLLVGRARGRYLRQGLRVNGPSSSERSRWVVAYANYLVEYDEHQALVELLERYELELEAVGDELPSTTLALHLVRGLIGIGRTEQALARAREVARLNHSAAVSLLRELGLEQEAWEVQLDWARGELDRGAADRGVALAVVEALLELGRPNEVRQEIRRAAAARPDDVETLTTLATVLAEHDRPADALRLRRRIYRISRSDAANLLEIARLEVELGQIDQGRRRALSLLARWAVPAPVEQEASELLVGLAHGDRDQQRLVIAALTSALDARSLDEDRAITLARSYASGRGGRVPRAVIERSIREAAAPWRSFQLLAAWEVASENWEAAERVLEAALVHSGGAHEVRRQLFIVRRRAGRHRAALAAIEITADRPGGTAMLAGLEPDEAAALSIRIADSATEIGWWAAADAYVSHALDHLDEETEPERVQQERARLHLIRSHLAQRSARSEGRPWIRREP